MANELKVKNGLIVQGPLTASFAYTTASWAQNAISASYAGTASVLLGAVTSASYAISASHANLADSALTAISASFATSASHANLADSALTAISASFATSASHANVSDTAITASFAVTSSNLIGWNFSNTGSIIAATNTASAVISVSTASYLAAFFDYAAVSASNSRCGTVFGSWVNGSITFAEVSNVDVGDTSQLTMSLGLNGNLAQLSASVSTTTPWTVRALARFI